jgi:hypothetical protein
MSLDYLERASKINFTAKGKEIRQLLFGDGMVAAWFRRHVVFSVKDSSVEFYRSTLIQELDNSEAKKVGRCILLFKRLC